MSSATSRLNAVSLWTGNSDPAIPVIEILPPPRFEGPRLADVIDAFQSDPLSTFHRQRYHVRQNHVGLLRRIREMYGSTPLAAINGRTLIEWHADWLGATNKVAMAHALIGQLRTVFGFGFTLLSDADCERLCHVLNKLRFQQAGTRQERITAEQAEAVRTWAHIIGWHSIAFGQALQFEGILRQKDCIGEYVPFDEPGASDIAFYGQKWLRGLRWREISADLILTHTTSKKQKPIEVDLKLLPMVMDELEYFDELPPPDEPLVICEATGMPYTASEYRRKWRIVARYAGIPDNVFNMDSRSGGISEAFEAEVPGERIQKTATHSDIGMTQKYNRGDQRKASDAVARGRSSKRRKLDAGTRDARWHTAQEVDVVPIGGKRSKPGAA